MIRIFVSFLLEVKLVDNDFLLADGAVLLLDKPILDAVAVMEVFAFENCNILVLVDLIVANTTNLFCEYLLLILGVW